MDSLRITLLIIGVFFIALIYAWERIRRRRQSSRYARWGGVSEDGSETHILGSNSGDPETDSRLVDTAYEPEYQHESHTNTAHPQIDSHVITPPHEQEIPEPEMLVDSYTHETNTIQPDMRPAPVGELTPDLESDPEIDTDPIVDITTELEALEEMISSEAEPGQMELGELEVENIQETNVVTEQERIIAVNVLAREGTRFNGPDILNAVMQLGLQYGDMNIFHRLDDNQRSIFSMANAIEPGVFDLSSMDTLNTPALLFIMAIPNPLHALEAFDAMLETARSLADSLNGQLCDERRSVLTRQAIDELRRELSGL